MGAVENPTEPTARVDQNPALTLRDTDAEFRRFVKAAEDFAVFLMDRTGNITTWSVGAEPPLVLRAANGGVENVESPCLPLGIFPVQDFPSRTLHLEPGDAVLLVTDGVTEARHGNEFLDFADRAALVREAIKTGSLPAAAVETLGGRQTSRRCLSAGGAARARRRGVSR